MRSLTVVGSTLCTSHDHSTTYLAGSRERTAYRARLLQSTSGESRRSHQAPIESSPPTSPGMFSSRGRFNLRFTLPNHFTLILRVSIVNRTPAIVVCCLGTMVLIAGCSTIIPSTPEGEPTQTAWLTNETAREYASTAQREHIYNLATGRGATIDQDATEITCRGRTIDRQANRHIVHTTCAGAIYYEDGTHIENAFRRALYLVQPDEVVRIDTRRRTHRTDRTQGETTFGSYSIYNLMGSNQSVTVTITYAGNGTRFGRFSYSLQEWSGVRQVVHRMPEGPAYEIRVKWAGHTKSLTWRSGETDHRLLVAVITKRGDLVVASFPLYDLSS